LPFSIATILIEKIDLYYLKELILPIVKRHESTSMESDFLRQGTE
jgi:hypothetical protein